MNDLADLALAFQIGFIGYLAAAMFIHGAYPRNLWLLIGVSLAAQQAAKNEEFQHHAGSFQEAFGNWRSHPGSTNRKSKIMDNAGEKSFAKITIRGTFWSYISVYTGKFARFYQHHYTGADYYPNRISAWLDMLLSLPSFLDALNGLGIGPALYLS